jgi:diguanylate cyclase (GGDEF)-like protein
LSDPVPPTEPTLPGDKAKQFPAAPGVYLIRDAECEGAAREKLKELATVDGMTGLFNRRYLENVLERECRRASRSGRQLSVVMMDVDHFKRFNDTWGHDGGDAVLHDLAELMRSMFRGEDVACRYGGEEFVVLLADTPLDDARRRAEDMRHAVHKLSVRLRQQPVGAITVSLGVASAEDMVAKLSELKIAMK